MSSGYGMGMGMQQPMYAASPPPMGAMGGGMGMGMGNAMSSPMLSPASRTASVATPPPSSATTQKSGGGFDDLWKTSLGSTGAAKPAQGAQKSMGELGKAKAQAGIWGASAAASPKPAGMGAPLGGFGGSTSGGAASSGGGDLLL